MPPALVLVRVGRMRRCILPLPVFLIWPLVLLAWLGLGLVWLVTSFRRRPRALVKGLLALRVLGELPGTRVDIRGRDESIYIRFI